MCSEIKFYEVLCKFKLGEVLCKVKKIDEVLSFFFFKKKKCVVYE